MTFSSTIFNIDVTGSQTPDPNDNLTVAHIHAGPLVTPTTNGPVVWGFFGSPFNDNNPNDALVTPFSTGVGGVFSGKWDLPEGNNTTLDAQLGTYCQAAPTSISTLSNSVAARFAAPFRLFLNL